MPVFEYRGLNEAGKAVTGLQEAESAKTLRTQLRKNGVFLTEVVGTADGVKKSGGKLTSTSRDVDLRKLAGGKISTSDVAIITRQLATLLAAGVTLVESLTALVDQADKERLKRILSDVKQRVNEGSSLGDALAQHQKVFGNLYVNMIRAGEASGALEAVLRRLADFTESQARLRQKVMGTLLYPAIMVAVGGGIMVMLMTVVVPKITKIFETMKATLPWTTRGLIWFSTFLQDWWFLIFPALFGAIYGFFRWIRSPTGKPHWDRWQLKFPVFGEIFRLLAIARFARTLSTLLKSGVPMLASMDIVKNVIENSVLAKVIEDAREAIREGESIANPIKKSGQFPPLVHHMIAIGEKSGQLEEMLVNVADNYESQVEVRVGALTSLMEPILIVVMGAMIAFVAFSILLPILQVNQAIR
jgi:general secretion pathway protein F